MKIRMLVALTLVLSLVGVFAAGAQEPREITKDTIVSTEIGSEVYYAATAGMDTPQARFLALAPILGQAAQNPVEFSIVQDPEKRTLFRNRSKSLGVEPSRLALWHDLFLNNGRGGLSALAPIDMLRYAEQSEGSWVLVDRFIDGEKVTNSSIYLWELVEMSENHVRFNVLLLESGVFETYLKLPPANGETYYLGSFTTVDVDLVTGADEWGASQGLQGDEQAMRVVWQGELMGHNYPGGEKPAPIYVDSMIVKQGGVYNQVRATVSVKNKGTRLSDYQTVQLMPMPNNSVAVYGSHRFDSHEAYEKVSDSVPVHHLDRYWEMAKRNPARFMDPNIMADPDRVRRLLARHAASKSEE